MKILIAKDVSGRKLYATPDGAALIIDGETEILMDVGVESVLQRGYWEPVEEPIEKTPLPQNINKKSAFTYR